MIPYIHHTIPNILIVDDVLDNLKVLGDLLRGEGYKVRPVPNGLMAIQVAEKERPDLILLDIMMPDIDGFEVCRRLKAIKLLQDVPIIFISALNDTNDIVKALTCGGSDYITKPFNAEEVKARVATHLKLFNQNKELQKLNADKDRFITILAHDLKSPFVGVLSFSELLALNFRNYDEEKTEKIVNIIHDSAKHFYMLLEELLLWARAQSGKIAYELQKVKLLDLCCEVIDVLASSAQNKSIVINQHIDHSIEVLADKNMVKTILRNLISNAIKFTPHGGSIDVLLKKTDNNEVIVSVKDTGIGISPASLNKLFDITQIQSTKGTDNETGTGFGLLLCKEFVEKQGGTIWVECEEGNGATFSFTLNMGDD